MISQAFTLRRKRPCDITSLYTEEEETLWYHKPLHWGGRDPVISQAFTLRRKRPCDITSLYTEEEETLWYHKPLQRPCEEEETLWYHKPLHWGGRDPVISQAFTLRRKRPCDITSLYTEEEEPVISQAFLHWGGRDPVISQAFTLRRKRPCDITSLPPEEEETLWYHRVSSSSGGRDPVISQAFLLRRKRPCDITSLYTEVGRDPVISQAFTLRRKRPCDITSLRRKRPCDITSLFLPEEEETLWYHKPLHWGGRDPVISQAFTLISQGLFLLIKACDITSLFLLSVGRDPVISQAFTLRRKRPCDITSLYTEEEETLWYHKPLHWGGRDPVISQVSSYLR